MRIRDQLRHLLLRGRTTIARRWYLALGTLLLMLPVVFAASAATGVYYTKADVLVLAPALSVDGNALMADPLQTVSFASIVVQRFNAEDGGTAPRSTSAPLHGSGIRKGHLVYLPSAGTQWQVSYNRPVITVEVVAESAEALATERDRIVNRISALAQAAQQERDIKTAVHITTELAPGTGFVTYVGVRNGTAVTALVFLTFGLTTAIPLLADRVMARIRTGAGARTRTAVNSGAQGVMLKSEPAPRENETAPPLT